MNGLHLSLTMKAQDSASVNIGIICLHSKLGNLGTSEDAFNYCY